MPTLPPKPVFWPGLLVLAFCCGCSLVGIKRAPSDLPPGEPPDCTASYTLPLVDFASAVLTGSGSVVLHGQASSERNEPDGGSSKEFRALGWTAAGLAVAFIASGAYGARQVQRCRGLQMGAGLLPAEGPNPNWQEESKPGAGQLGGACSKDSDCSEELVCDEPMKTCVELPPVPTSPAAPEESPPPSTTPDAGPSPPP